MEASMVSAYVRRAAEWVTREAMQIHGGMGYAEEYPVSRYRTPGCCRSSRAPTRRCSLKVIARRLLAG
ncbi:MAG: acyl-CoA dehydrogenase family protein [Acidimicrobiales bacterium]